jgi:hypothetical protein
VNSVEKISLPLRQTIARQATLGVWGIFGAFILFSATGFLLPLAQHSTASESEMAEEKLAGKRRTTKYIVGSNRQLSGDRKKHSFCCVLARGLEEEVEREMKEVFRPEKMGNFSQETHRQCTPYPCTTSEVHAL